MRETSRQAPSTYSSSMSSRPTSSKHVARSSPSSSVILQAEKDLGQFRTCTEENDRPRVDLIVIRWYGGCTVVTELMSSCQRPPTPKKNYVTLNLSTRHRRVDRCLHERKKHQRRTVPKTIRQASSIGMKTTSHTGLLSHVRAGKQKKRTHTRPVASSSQR